MCRSLSNLAAFRVTCSSSTHRSTSNSSVHTAWYESARLITPPSLVYWLIYTGEDTTTKRHQVYSAFEEHIPRIPKNALLVNWKPMAEDDAWVNVERELIAERQTDVEYRKRSGSCRLSRRASLIDAFSSVSRLRCICQITLMLRVVGVHGWVSRTHACQKKSWCAAAWVEKGRRIFPRPLHVWIVCGQLQPLP